MPSGNTIMERERRLALRLSERRESLRAALVKLRARPRRLPHIAARIHKRVRKKITGAEDRRVRDHIRERIEEPPVVRFIDKISFLFGVGGCALIEYAVIQQPHRFSFFYATFMIPLLSARLWLYMKLKWHWFMLDFCYAANLLCLVQVMLLPNCKPLIILNYMSGCGPLALAIPTWRNSLVFHSLDKITSTFLHALPALLLFCARWYPPDGLELPPTLDLFESFAIGLGGYVVWQCVYLLQTELMFGGRLRQQQDLMTSIRWLTTPPYSGITLVVHKVLGKCGVLKPGEMFDSERWKTKLIFIIVQLLYTAVTLLPVPLFWASFRLHVVVLIGIFAVCIWNGASYYIEVFSTRYRQQFEGDAASRKEAYLASFGAPKREVGTPLVHTEPSKKDE
uniref:Glycerophosphocholine acyltransferase 1 n=1 Tax=Coccolithus braarudii TaxID=221442 RepID=A0A7S0LBS8_9EUKA